MTDTPQTPCAQPSEQTTGGAQLVRPKEPMTQLLQHAHFDLLALDAWGPELRAPIVKIEATSQPQF